MRSRPPIANATCGAMGLFHCAVVAMLAVIVAASAYAAESPASLVTIRGVSTNRPYTLVSATVGTKTCIDRNFVVTALPPTLVGGTLLQVSNEDDYVEAAQHVLLTLDRPAVVYVCYDARPQTIPVWLNEWKLADLKVANSDTSSRVFMKSFPAGPVRLGGNARRAGETASNYYAIIVADASAPATPPAAKVDFARQIQPILKSQCYECHGPTEHEGGLRLDVRLRALQGGDNGNTILPGDSERSELIRRLKSLDDAERMPQDAPPLSEAQVAVLRTWIDQGAPWPDALAGEEEETNHWAFRAVQRPPVPDVTRPQRVRNAIDRFILARLDREQLEPSPPADRAMLIRRLSLDLVGLPPTEREVAAFLADARDDAYDRLVDRLLESPHFGERWGRHWLDLARYADSDGYENDKIRPHAWRYRDWVIDAINRDLPFDQFTIEQLAGDLLPNPRPDQLVATGFHRNTLFNSAGGADAEEFRTKAVKDRAETSASIWMALTMSCCQCHSHKYDPIAQQEYYRFYAFFNNTDDCNIDVPGGKAQTIAATQRRAYVHKRGNFLSPGNEVQPGTPAFLPPLAPRGHQADRLDLARWMVDPAHPLTARVAVNHFWQHLFGEPLVPTAENFGRKGEPPVHGELLDWLAAELVELKWSRKQLLRTIVMSATYRQSSVHRDDLAEHDPTNVLLARQNRFRLEGEAVRDVALAASGLIKLDLGGPSIQPPLPTGIGQLGELRGEVFQDPKGDRYRRGVYIHVQRTFQFPMLSTFDVADGNAPCIRRDRSTTPMQALTLLNDPCLVECAAALGERMRRTDGDTRQRIDRAFVWCLARTPTDAERDVLMELLDRQRKAGAGDSAAYAGVARALLNLEEFTTRE